jgi:hypothetical protein
MARKVITLSDYKHNQYTSFYIDEGIISPYENFNLAFKWYKAGKLSSRSKDIMDQIIEEQNIQPM